MAKAWSSKTVLAKKSHFSNKLGVVVDLRVFLGLALLIGCPARNISRTG